MTEDTVRKDELTYPLPVDIAAVTGREVEETVADPSIEAALDELAEDHDHRPPRVVMTAGNNITVDARVLKAMATVSRFGAEVIAVGLADSKDLPKEDLGDVTILRVRPAQRVALSGFRGRLRRIRLAGGEIGRALVPWFTNDLDFRGALGRWELQTRNLRADRGKDVRDRDRQLVVEDEPVTGDPRVDKVRRAVRWRSLRAQRKVLSGRASTIRSGASRVRVGQGTSRRRSAALRTMTAVPGLGSWRAVLPEVLDQDLAVGPVLDGLEPDVIHVHDVFMIGIAVRSAQRAALIGRTVKIIYDAHEYIPGLAMVSPRKVAAYSALESEFMRDVDRVVTVSAPLAEMLQRDYNLRELPDVVLNAPIPDDPSIEVVGVRTICGLAEDVPLLVYGGGVHPARGVHTVVDALAHLPGVHLVVVVKRLSAVTEDLVARAEAFGAGDRLHFAPFVPPELVPRYLSSATVGVSPLLRAVNHDVAITNKFCEYLNAGLPIVTSDTPAQADLVQELGLGAVHVAGDPVDCARAVREVLDHVDDLHARIAGDAALRHAFSWTRQAEVLRTVYDEVLGGLPETAWREDATMVRRLLVQE